MEYREIVDIIYAGLTRKPPAYCLPVSPILRVANLLDWIISKAGIRFSLGTTILKMNKPTFYKSDKIRKFGFSPVCSSKEGLEKMVKWFIENKKQES
jgi:nucleoside-diphosphate-sugar epimerase